MKALLRLTMTVAMGYVPLGAAFGFLCIQSGGTVWLALGLSLFLYAGAMQFLAIPLLAAGTPLPELAFLTLATNLRHMFYGLALTGRMPQGRLARAYTIFALTDETFSLLTAGGKDAPPRALALVAGLNQGWWVAGTLIGCLLGRSLPQGLAGVDFALTALFTVLLIEQARSLRRAPPFLIGLGAVAVALAVMPGNMLFAAILLATAAIAAAGMRAKSC